ncbi:MAG: Abi family protein [Actinomycetia bacterium]|nr:Abi family protein [Actinomycetes bacterium]
MAELLKPWLSIQDQIDRLQRRGMQIPDEEVAAQWLSAVGYYRLSGYWYPFREIDATGQARRLSTFVSSTTFAEVVGLYEFDRHLKTLLQSGLERVEVALRSQVGHQLGAIDPLAHADPIHFRSTFNHVDWRSTAEARVRRARGRDEFVDHHYAVYGGSLPIWVLTDVLDFSDLSKLYAGLKSSDQKVIAEWFRVGLPPSATQSQRRRWRDDHPLANWLEHLTVVRNICAHHGRLWNRRLTPVGTSPRVRHLPVFGSLPTDQTQVERVYGTICVIAYLLDAASPGHSWRTKVDDLVSTWFSGFTLRSTSEMGYPNL